MNRWYTRAERRTKRKEQAALVAAKLMGKKRYQDYFSGTDIQQPIQYGSRTATAVNRMNESAPFIIPLAQEPEDAAKKHQEEETNPVPQQPKQVWPRMPLQYDPYGALWIGHRDD